FEGETQSDIIAAILTAEAEPIAGEKQRIPAEFERIISKALQKKREQRYQSARELLIDLKNLRQDLEIAARLKRTTDEIRLSRATGEIRPAKLSLKMIASRNLRLHRSWLILLGAIVCSAIVWWSVRRFDQNHAELLSSLRQSPVYNQKCELNASVPDGTISPDGRMIAFSLSRSGSHHIWLKLVGEGEPVEITKGRARDSNPIWSPDGLQIAYISQNADGVGIWRIPAIGGA